MFDDHEGDAAHNKMLVGAMNAASKFTKTEGEEEQLGGVIFTKNLKLGMKMPTKIVEGRNNWILMKRDPSYESEDMGVNIEKMFDHCNRMCDVKMPRDFLAKLTQYFFRAEDQDLTFFQEAQREASEIVSARRPHWGKRKVKSGSLFISIFFLIDKEVAECDDIICKELFVEVFSSKNDYIDLVMRAMDRTDEIEALLCDGKTLSIPGWTYDGEDGDESDEAPTRTRKESSSEVDVDELVLSCLNLVTDLNEVDRSKYIKVFSKDEGLILGIQHTKLKNYAKENDKIVPKFQAQSRFYPSFVTLKTEAFTKVKSTSSRGASNTQAGFCTSVIIGKLNMITRKRIQELFGLTDDVLLMDDDEISEDPLASQDYPMFSQTQSKETLQVCESVSSQRGAKVH